MLSFSGKVNSALLLLMELYIATSLSSKRILIENGSNSLFKFFISITLLLSRWWLLISHSSASNAVNPSLKKSFSTKSPIVRSGIKLNSMFGLKVNSRRTAPPSQFFGAICKPQLLPEMVKMMGMCFPN